MIIHYERVGQKIRAARRTQGLTQQELALESRISPAFMGHIERGSRIPSLETIVKLCQVLGVSVDSVLLGAVSEAENGAQSISNAPADVKHRVRSLLSMASWELDQMTD